MKKKVLVLTLSVVMIFTLFATSGCSSSTQEVAEEVTDVVEQVIVVKKDSGIKSWDDLAGKMMSVEDGSEAFDNLNSGDAADLANTLAALIVEATVEQAWDDFEKGAVDAVALENTVAEELMQNEDIYEILPEKIG